MRIRRTADQWTNRQIRQTSDRRQTPTSDSAPRPDFEHQTSDFGLLTLNFTLQI